MLIPSEKVIIQAFAHDIRRTVLKVLQARPYSFTELMKLLNLPSGKLNYHLSQIAGFINKNEKTGMYESTILGSKAIDFLELLQSHLTDNEIPFLCEAYISQMAGKENVQQLRQNYLIGIIQAVHLIQGLQKLAKENIQELPNHLFQIEATIKKKLTIAKRSQRKLSSFSDSTVDLLQGAYDTFTHTKLQLFHKRQTFPRFLSRLESEAKELLDQLGKKDFDSTTFSTGIDIGEDLAEEFSRFETES